MGIRKNEREYSEEELALFAKCKPLREEVRPRQCRQLEKCWVELGPPAYQTNRGCVGCGGEPRHHPLKQSAVTDFLHKMRLAEARQRV